MTQCHSSKIIARIAFSIAAFMVLFAFEAQSVESTRYANATFPVSGTVAQQVRLWENIFSRYGVSQALIHDQDYPDILVDLIDFTALQRRQGRTRPYLRAERDQISLKYLERYQLAVSRFKRFGKRAVEFGPMEQRVHTVYSKYTSALDRLYAGRVVVRVQGGLKDEFQAASKRAEKYLPYMEKIFFQHNLPVDLTRIAFVESMFNTNAISKVGASGIWQFMPSTARLYMSVNNFIDERNSIFRSTRAAALFLAENYRDLKSWPLAVTAYNHGRAGMAKAARKLGTRDLSYVIDHYRSNSFGFASKNFYSEFIAARNVYNRLHYPSRKMDANPLGIAQIPIRRRMTVADLLKITALDKEMLMKYNPSLLPSAFGPYRYHPIPFGYELTVPVHVSNEVSVAIKGSNSPNTYTRRY